MQIKFDSTTLLENTGDIVLSYEAPDAKVVYRHSTELTNEHGYVHNGCLVVSDLADIRTNRWNVATVDGVALDFAIAFIYLAFGGGEVSDNPYAEHCYEVCGELIKALSDGGITVTP